MTKNIRNMVFCALCIAIGLILPMALHVIPNAGSIFLPMHIPVLLCGLLCGSYYGLLCGLLVPVLSSVLTGMPPAPILPGMICELAMYGFMTGWMSKKVHLKNELTSTYVQLIIAMISGRLFYGILNGLIFAAGKYSLQVFISAAFVTALPGIVIQLVFLPSIVVLLRKVNNKYLEQKV
ncbi:MULTISPECIES: ECF transporter S component [Erysipelotrichaceae]|uniref:ECF transporter S component n=1 Tax=Erysipelotrichaceae TaxID=128827 RepID=UPI000E411462|nr:ECF transporter S component [Absiella sp. AM29-15]RGC52794.1 ECF transporter S component [Absiella sp. AM29-15]